MTDLKFYSGQKVLITGNTGFKGTWLTAMLLHLGAEVVGIASFKGKTNPTFKASGLSSRIKQYEVDIRDAEKIEAVIETERPRFVFHLAAQALTLKALEEPVPTFQINVQGTANLLEAVRKTTITCSIVVVTSDKCYENKEWYWSYRESDRVFASDPYGASKSMAENVVHAYHRAFFDKTEGVKVCTVRSGNVFGGGDWSENRLVPDCIRAWSENREIEVRSPEATRPWSYVLDVLYGYLQVCKELTERDELNGESFNFGPNSHGVLSVLGFVERIWQHYRTQEIAAPVKIHSDSLNKKEHQFLQLSSEKVRTVIGWRPNLDFDDSVQETVEWYKQYLDNKTMAAELLNKQASEYLTRISLMGI